MSKIVQMRNTPDGLHRKLKARSVVAQKRLPDYLLEVIRTSAEHPTLEEMKQRLASRKPIDPSISLVEAVRAERDSR